MTHMRSFGFGLLRPSTPTFCLDGCWLGVQCLLSRACLLSSRAPLLGEHYPSFIAHTGSCAGPSPSLPFHVQAYRQGPCRLGHPRLVRRTFPALSRCSFRKCCVPYPGSLSGARVRFFPDNIGLASFLLCSAVYRHHRQRLPAVKAFRSGRHFVMLRHSRLFASLTVLTNTVYQQRRLYPQSLLRVCYLPRSLINYPTEPDNCWDGTFTR